MKSRFWTRALFLGLFLGLGLLPWGLRAETLQTEEQKYEQPSFWGHNITAANHLSAELSAIPYKKNDPSDFATQLNFRGLHNLAENFQLYGNIPVYYLAQKSPLKNHQGLGNMGLGFTSYLSFPSDTGVWTNFFGIALDATVPTASDEAGMSRVFGATPSIMWRARRQELTFQLDMGYVFRKFLIGSGAQVSANSFQLETGVAAHVHPMFDVTLEYLALWTPKITGSVYGVYGDAFTHNVVPGVLVHRNKIWGGLYLGVPIDSVTRDSYYVTIDAKVGYQF